MYIIGGKFKKRRLVVPNHDQLRPTTSQLREAFFNICQFRIEGARFLDLFAGSGAMGLEALSRGAAQVTFVEKNSTAVEAIRKNITSLEVGKWSSVLKMEVSKALQTLYKSKQRFEIIYADPPYGHLLGDQVLSFLDQYPLLSEEGSLFIEESTPQFTPTEQLQLYDQRKVGHSYLCHFRIRGALPDASHTSSVDEKAAEEESTS